MLVAFYQKDATLQYVQLIYIVSVSQLALHFEWQ